MTLDITVSPPSSQSIATRALIAAALSQGTSVLEGSFRSQDLQVMAQSLWQLGLKVSQDPKKGTIRIEGRQGIFPVDEEYLDAENSPLAANFLAAALAFSRGTYRISGGQRVQQFPMGDLIFSLSQLGADVRSENAFDTPPLLIEGIHGRQGISPSSKRYGINSEMSGTGRRFAALGGTVSSQYVCSILLASPLAALNGDVVLHVLNQWTHCPYVAMTLDIMKDFGVEVLQSTAPSEEVLFSKGTTYKIPQNSRYSPRTYYVEPDAALANYAFAAAAIAGGKVVCKNLSGKTIQKELEFIYCLNRMGCNVSFQDQSVSVSHPERAMLRGISVDMFDMTDSIQSFAVCALFASSPSRITNIGHLRRKEPTWIPKLVSELRRFGANINEVDDGFLIIPTKHLRPARIEAGGDARLAMGLGLLGLRLDGVSIDDPSCVNRAWPNFFREIGLNY